MTIPLRNWTRGDKIHAADLNRIVEAIRRATPVQGNGILVSQSRGGSVISLAGGARGGGGGSADGGDYPFRIRRVNSGTAETPAWHTVVYVPEDSITVTASTSITYIRDADSTQEYDPSAMPRWYEYAQDDGFGAVALQLALYLDRSTGALAYKCYWRLAKLGDGLASWNPEPRFGRGKFEIPLGVVAGTGAGDVYNLVRSAIYAARVSFYSSGGEGGTVVEMADERTDQTKEGVVGFTGFGPDGSVMLVANSLLPSDGVGIADTGVNLTSYLGGTEAEGFGANLNTDNFADECLGPALTPSEGAEGADPDLAAPSIHEHTLSQLQDEEGNYPFDNSGAFVAFLDGLGLWDSLGETGPSGEPPSEDSILTVGDIEDDASYLKRDAAVPDAGDITTDLLVLSGHRHPLNVADVAMATGPTGTAPTPPPAEDYVLPVGVGTTGPSGEASPSTAAFGVQPFYARVDHIHPICVDMGPTASALPATVAPSGGMDKSMADYDGDALPTGPSGVTLDTTGWNPGANGYVESYCCRVAKINIPMVGEVRYAIFRRRAVSRTGAVLWVGPEYVGFSM